MKKVIVYCICIFLVLESFAFAENTKEVTLECIADSYTENSIRGENRNFGREEALLCGKVYSRTAYLKFDISRAKDYEFESAVLNLNIGTGTPLETINVFAVSSDWTEYGITASNAPKSTDFITYFKLDKIGRYSFRVDIADYIKSCLENGEIYASIAVTSEQSTTSIASRENSDKRNSPKLVLYKERSYIPGQIISKFNTPSKQRVLEDINNNVLTASRPFLHANTDDFERIKSLIGKDDYVTKAYELIKDQADNLLTAPVININRKVNQTLRNVPNIIMQLYLASYVEGDQKYIDRAMEEYRNLLTIETWYVNDFLDTCASIMAMAFCYDWLNEYLTQAQKDDLVEKIKVYVLDIYTEYFEDRSAATIARLRARCNNTVMPLGRGSFNHNIYNASFAGIAALAIADVDPEYSANIISNTLYNVEAFLEESEPDGGFTECSGYWRMSAEPLAKYYSSINSVFGTMYDYEKTVGFKLQAHFPIYIQGSLGVMVWADTHQGTRLADESLYFYAKKGGDLNSLSEIVNSRNIMSIYTLLWYEEGLHDELGKSELNLDKLFRNVDAVTMRDAWEGTQEIFTGMQVGKASRGHGDASSGMFALDAFGERFITVQGRIEYTLPNYWHYGQNGGRWNYYARRTEGNNALVINPSLDPGQLVDVVPTIEGFESGDGSAYAWTDLTEVYSREVSSYVRGIKFHKNRSRIVIQDEVVAKRPSTMYWSFNTSADIELLDDGKSALLSIGDKKVYVMAQGNVDYKFKIERAVPLPTSPQISEQPRWRGFRKLVVTVDSVTDFNFMVEFTPFLTDSEMPDSISEFIEISEWTVENEYEENLCIDSILINGEEIEEFNPANRYYEILYDELPKSIPTVSPISANDYTMSVDYPETLPGKIIINVSGDSDEGKTTSYVVSINHRIKPVDVSNMKQIVIKSANSSHDDGNVASNAIDDDPNTRWSASGLEQDPYLELDLGSIRQPKLIGISFFSGDIRQSYFEISVSTDGQQWKNVIVEGESSGKTTDFEYFELGNEKARYIRYIGQQNSVSHWNSIIDMKIYE